MGYIGYPIESHHIRKSSWDTHAKLLQQGLHIEFDIGEIEMDISREALQYSDRTISAIRSKLDDIVIDINKTITDEIAKAKSLYQARVLYAKIPYSTKQLCGSITYKGIDLEQRIDVSIYKIAAIYASNSPPWYNIHTMNYVEDAVIYVNDITAPYTAIVHEDIKTRGKIGYVFKFEDDKEKKECLTKIGIDESDVIYVSTLKVPAVTTTPKTPRKKTSYKRKTRKYIPKKHGMVSSFWVEETVDLSAGGYYVEFSRFSVKYDKRVYNPQHLNAMLELLDIKDDVYGFVPADIKKLDKSKWTNIFDEFATTPKRKEWSTNLGIYQAYININRRNTIANMCAELSTVSQS
jgi:hypothetical protein